MFETLFDPAEFLSPYGLPSISAYHRANPFVIVVEGMRATVDYEPAESTGDMFGGNGAGLGASHQTGWTGLVAAIIRRRHGASPSAAETIQRIIGGGGPQAG